MSSREEWIQEASSLLQNEGVHECLAFFRRLAAEGQPLQDVSHTLNYMMQATLYECEDAAKRIRRLIYEELDTGEVDDHLLREAYRSDLEMLEESYRTQLKNDGAEGANFDLCRKTHQRLQDLRDELSRQGRLRQNLSEATSLLQNFKSQVTDEPES